MLFRSRLAARRRRPGVFEELRDRFEAASELLTADDPGRTEYYRLAASLDAAVDEAMDSPYLLRSLQGLRTHAVRARRLSRDNLARLVKAAGEHRLITEAIIESDETLAAQATAVHLRASLATILASLTAPDHAPAAPEPAPEPAPQPAPQPAPHPNPVGV